MKKCYYTDIQIQCKLGLLSEENRKRIPKSTQYTWKNKDFSKFVGSEIIFSDENLELIRAFLSNQTLRNAAKSLFFIYSTLISITKNVRGMKTIMRKNREKIVETIDYVIPFIGLKHACKLFQISIGQFFCMETKSLLFPFSGKEMFKTERLKYIAYGITNG